jgi:hypothetical protein
MFDKMSQWILINKSITRFVVFCVPSLFINNFISFLICLLWSCYFFYDFSFSFFFTML